LGFIEPGKSAICLVEAKIKVAIRKTALNDSELRLGSIMGFSQIAASMS
jgi:hypothetical protein